MKRPTSERIVRVLPGMGGFIGWVIVMLASWYWALGYGGQAAWFVAVCTGVLLVYAVIVRWGWLTQPKVTRVVSDGEAHAGDTVRVRLTIRRQQHRYPLAWVHVRDELRGADGKLAYVHQKLLFLGASAHYVYEYEMPRLRRGIYTFGEVMLASTEPLGIVGRSWRMADVAGGGMRSRRLTIYPQPLARLADVMPRRAGESGAAAVAAMAAASPLVSTVREYAHGDPLQRIHWKSTARTGGLKTKELDALQERRVTVVLDDAADAYGRERMARARFETAASAACAVVMDAKRQGLALRLRCGGAAVAAAGEAPGTAERRALELLARAEPSGRTPLVDTLREHAVRLSADEPLILITPRLDEQLLEHISMLRARRVGVTVLYVGEGTQPSERVAHQLRMLDVMGCRADFIAVAVVDGSRGQAASRRRDMGGVATHG